MNTNISYITTDKDTQKVTVLPMAETNQSWWYRRTACERYLAAGLVASGVVVVTLVAVMVWGLMQLQDKNPERPESSGKQSGVASPEDGVCLTPECVHTASRVLSYMDNMADPCDDFYAFACGQYMRTSTIPDDKTAVSVFSLVSDVLMEQLRSILEEAPVDKDTRPVALIKKLYRACMDKTRIEHRGLDPMKKILDELGGWPVLRGKHWNQNDFDWKSTVYGLGRVGLSVDSIIDMSVVTDSKNSTRRIITFDQPELGLSREYLVKGFGNNIVQAYHEYQIDVAVILGADTSRARREMKHALEFETALAAISLPSEDRRNSSLLYNAMSLGEMQKRFPTIPWLEYVNNILPREVRVDLDELVIVVVPTFIEQLEKLLADTDKRVQANYILWQAARSIVSYTTDELKSSSLKYITKLTGRQTQVPRWRECTNDVTNGISLITGSVYVRRFFDRGSKRAALELVSDIQHTFRDMLRQIDWMEEETRKKGLAKASAMAVNVGYPDELLDDAKLDEFYSKLHLDERLYLESVLNLTKFSGDFTFSRLRTPVNKTEWIKHGSAAVVNAFYSPVENSITFPAGILQSVFFNSARPKYMNYGSIGFVIGHEITHGFDDQGRQYDGDGRLVDWWEPRTREKFLRRTACIIEQYGNFTEPLTGLKLNGINTQGENIADNGGIKEAYLAYMRWSERKGVPEPRLPGLDWLTPRQMFWVAVAQTWCTKFRPEAMRQRIITGVHSPGQFRVLGPLSNTKEFAKDFECPKHSYMNPARKCQVW